MMMVVCNCFFGVGTFNLISAFAGCFFCLLVVS